MPKVRTVFDDSDNIFTTMCDKKFYGSSNKINMCLRMHKKKCAICINYNQKAVKMKRGPVLRNMTGKNLVKINTNEYKDRKISL